jgi:hypothetical protein
MMRNKWLLVLLLVLVRSTPVCADVVLDWNETVRHVMKSDGNHEVNHANPGWATRSIAMMNGAIYDAFQSIDRTHTPFLYQPKTSGASLEAAVHTAARDVLVDCYQHLDEANHVEGVYSDRMALVADGPEKTAGIALGQAIAHAYKTMRADDGLKEGSDYVSQPGPGYWRTDPWNPGQVAWGPQWGTVDTFVIGPTTPYIDALPVLPALDSAEYATAYNQVLDYGALDVYGPDDTPTSRSDDQSEIALFWAYDRKTMGPPPVLFNRSLSEIAQSVGNSPEDNALMFAMTSMAQADAAVAAWDAKFKYNFWRPVAGIHEADTDGNGATDPDTDWRPLGAPGELHEEFTDDFTPPFPAWTSGHATMGAAVYKTLELFYGTNEFEVADELMGDDAVTSEFMLTSEEEGGGGSRMFTNFAHYGTLDVDSYAGSPDGENGISRLFMGVHWIMDQRDGVQLGHMIATDIFASRFAAVPEPNAIALALLGALSGLAMSRCRSRA